MGDGLRGEIERKPIKEGNLEVELRGVIKRWDGEVELRGEI